MSANFLYFSFLLLFSTLTGFSIPPINKIKANNVLIRTNRVIGHASMSVKTGKNLTGDLAQSVHYERVAKAFFKNGDYEKAIYHSRLSRIYAVKAIKANRVKLPMDAAFSSDEEQLFTATPIEKELEMEAKLKDSSTLEDKDLLNGNLGVDLNK